MKILKPFLIAVNLFVVAAVLVSSTGIYETIWHDATLTGEGTEASPLGVNRGGEITPSQITGDQDDYNPTSWDDATVVRISGDNGIRAVTSLAPPTTSLQPKFKKVINVGDYPVYFPGNHVGGTSTYRIISDRDFMLFPGQSADFVYDETDLRWRITTPPPLEPHKGQFLKHTPGSVTAADHHTWAVGGSGGGNSNLSSTGSLPASAVLSTLTSSTAVSTGYFMKNVTTNTGFSVAHLSFEAQIYIPTLSDGTNTFRAHAQIINSSSATGEYTSNNIIGIRYSDGINSGKWEGYSRDNAGAETVTDLGITVAAATLYKLRIEIDKSKTEVRFYVDGRPVGTPITANLPSSVQCGARCVIAKTVGTTARTLNICSMQFTSVYP